MSVPSTSPLTVSAFLAWLDEGPEGERWELVAGEPVSMAPERVSHARLKARMWRALSAAIETHGISCEALPDGLTVVVDDYTAYEPDASVRCGDPLPGDDLVVPDPVIVVEVLSPTMRGRDAGAKLEDYFRIPSVVHYLLVKTERPVVIHHRRGDDGSIQTRIASEGALTLDPPGITLELDDVYHV